MTKAIPFLNKNYVRPINSDELLLQYKNIGLKPILLRGKHSIISGFGKKSKTYDEMYEDIKRKQRMENYNIGLLCGDSIKGSGVFVIDEDIIGEFGKLLKTSKIELPINTPIVKTGRGGSHYYFQYTPDLNDVLGKTDFLSHIGFKGLDIRTNHQYIVAVGSTYAGCQNAECMSCEKCKCINNVYEWIKPPIVDANGRWLLPEVPIDLRSLLPRTASKKVISTSEVIAPSNNDLYRTIFLTMLKESRATNYSDWVRCIFMIKALTDDRDLAHSFSKRSISDNYDAISVDKVWDGFQNERSPTLGSLKRMLIEDIGEVKTKELFQTYGMPTTIEQYDLIKATEKDFAELYLQLRKDTLVVDKRGRIYFYDEEAVLWRHINESLIIDISNTLTPYINKVFEEADWKQNKKITRIITTLGTQKNLKSIETFIKTLLTQAYPIADRLTMNNHPNSLCLLPTRDKTVIDMRTLITRERNKLDYFTFESKVKYTLENENKLDYSGYDYIFSLSNDREGVASYFEECFGYWLSGEIWLKMMFVMIGKKDCGKSTLSEIVLRPILEELWKPLSEELIIKNSKQKAGNVELDDIIGSRLAVASEFDIETDQLNPKAVKRFVGGDSHTYRMNYANNMISTQTSAKIVIYTNSIPEFSSGDTDFVDKIAFLDFNKQFDKSVDFIKKIQNQDFLDDFFSQCVRGFARLYKRKSFNIPIEIIACRQTCLIEAEDEVNSFINQYRKEGGEVSANVLYHLFKQETNDKTITSNMFGRKVRKAGIRANRKKLTNGKFCVVYEGLCLEQEQEQEQVKLF